MRIAATTLLALLVGAAAHAQGSLPPRCLGSVPPPIDVPLCVFYPDGNPPGSVPAHYLLQPPACGSGPRPLLVLFRGAEGGIGPGWDCGSSVGENFHWGPYVNSDLMQTASSFGWYALSPLGKPGYTYAYEQTNFGFEQAIADVLSSYPIDRERIYAIGFSMGGISALNYVARHLDPESDLGMFAASITLSGDSSLSMFWGLQCASRNPMQAILGLGQCPLDPPTCFCMNPAVDPTTCAESPSNTPFPYQRASALHSEPCFPFTLDLDGSLALNLMHVPMWGRADMADPTGSIYAEMYMLDQLMIALGHPQWDYAEVDVPCANGGHHCWQIHETIGVFQALHGLTLQIPSSARVLVPDDGWYFHFRATRGDDQQLGDFTWNLDKGTNQLDLDSVVNVTELRVRTADSGTTHHSGLDPDQVLKVVFGASTSALDLVLEGYDAPGPSRVAAQAGGGRWVILSSPQDWSWDSAEQAVHLTPGPHPQQVTWQVLP